VDANLLIVAAGFRIVGWLIGVPSLLTLLSLGGSFFVLGQSLPPDPSESLDLKTYGLVALLAQGAEALGKTLYFLAGLALWIVVAAATAALLTLIFAVILYATGRGIGNHATWARIVGGLITVGLLLCSLGLLAALRSDLALLAWLPIGLSLYTLWVLCWRFE
jgi:hypothetical protein